MGARLLSHHCLLDTSDRDEAIGFVSSAWEFHSATIRRGRYGLAWHQATLGRGCLAFVETRCAERTIAQGTRSDVFRVGIHLGGGADFRFNGKPAAFAPGRVVLQAPGQDVCIESEPFRMLFLALPGSAVRRSLQRRFDTLPPLETWAAGFPVDRPAVQGLVSLCRWAAKEVDRRDAIIGRSPRSTAYLERVLLALFIDCLAERRPGGNERFLDLDEAQVRMIEDWMEANLYEPIGLEELASVVGANPRAVQRAFRRLRGCSPTQRLMQRRLTLAKQLLCCPEAGTTVTSVAADVGCFHFGRFSVRYREMFGEKPSETLRRGLQAMR